MTQPQSVFFRWSKLGKPICSLRGKVNILFTVPLFKATGVWCSVTSQSQKLQEKLARKERRRGPSRGGPSGGQDAELAWLLDNGMETLVEADQVLNSIANSIAGPQFMDALRPMHGA